MVQQHLPTLAATFLAVSLVLVSEVAMSQTPQPSTPILTSANPTANGPYESLSPGNQKIVRALYQAQQTDSAMKPLTLDQIAARKVGGGWGEVFKRMQSQGLIQAKNLGEVISTYNHRHQVGALTTAANHSESVHGDAGTPQRDHDRDFDDRNSRNRLGGLKQTDGSHADSASSGGRPGGGAGLAARRGR